MLETILRTSLFPSFVFRLSFELRVRMLDRNDRCQTFLDIVLREGFVFFQKVVFPPVLVQNTGQGQTEAVFMEAAFRGIDVVDEESKSGSGNPGCTAPRLRPECGPCPPSA